MRGSSRVDCPRTPALLGPRARPSRDSGHPAAGPRGPCACAATIRRWSGAHSMRARPASWCRRSSRLERRALVDAARFAPEGQGNSIPGCEWQRLRRCRLAGARERAGRRAADGGTAPGARCVVEDPRPARPRRRVPRPGRHGANTRPRPAARTSAGRRGVQGRVASAAAKGKRAAFFAPTTAAARRSLARGLAHMTVSEDTAILRLALTELRAAIDPPGGRGALRMPPSRE